jgi:hypothetical protein
LVSGIADAPPAPPAGTPEAPAPAPVAAEPNVGLAVPTPVCGSVGSNCGNDRKAALAALFIGGNLGLNLDIGGITDLSAWAGLNGGVRVGPMLLDLHYQIGRGFLATMQRFGGGIGVLSSTNKTGVFFGLNVDYRLRNPDGILSSAESLSRASVGGSSTTSLDFALQVGAAIPLADKKLRLMPYGAVGYGKILNGTGLSGLSGFVFLGGGFAIQFEVAALSK